MIDQPLRIVLCTSGGLHGALVLRRLLASPSIAVTGIVLSSRLLRPSEGFVQGAMAFLRLSGLRYTLYLWVSTSLADALLRLSPMSTLAPVSAQARRHGIPIVVTRQVNDTQGQRFVEDAAPDLLVSAFFNQRIEAPLANWPRQGAVNIHPSPLPDFRGVDPVFHATLQRSAGFGVSVHRITAEFDAGAILAAETRVAETDSSVWWRSARLYDRGAELLVRALDRIKAGDKGSPQPGGGRYDSWPTPLQVAQLHRQGGKLVAMRDLLNLLRGRLPIPPGNADH